MSSSMKTSAVVSLVVAAMTAFGVVALIGAGCHSMGIRHSGAHILVEFVAVFTGTLVSSAVHGIATRAALARTRRSEVDPDAPTLHWNGGR
jgi:hypothetical protein